MMPATLSIITNAFPPHERGKAIGTWAGVSAIALAIGPLLGGLLVEHVSWRAIFYINVPVAVVAVAVTLFAAHESRDETVGRSVDIPGIVDAHRRPGRAGARAGRGQPVGLGLARDPRAVRDLARRRSSRFVVDRARTCARRWSTSSSSSSRTFLGANLVAFIDLVRDARRCSSSSPSTCRTSSATRRSRPACCSCPTTVVIMVLGPIAGRLTDRVGPRGLIVFGLTARSRSRCSGSPSSRSTPAYGSCSPALHPAWASASP